MVEKPALSLLSYVRVAVWPQLHGWFLGAVPLAAAVGLVYVAANNMFTDQPYTLLESIELDDARYAISVYSERCVTNRNRWNRRALNAQGRAGLIFIVIGITLLVRSAWLLIPDTEDTAAEAETQEHVEWQPVDWRRLFVSFVGLSVAGILIFVLELSYLSIFQENVYLFTALLCVGGLVLRAALDRALSEHLISKPLGAAYFAVCLASTLSMSLCCCVSACSLCSLCMRSCAGFLELCHLLYDRTVV